MQKERNQFNDKSVTFRSPLPLHCCRLEHWPTHIFN